MVDDHPMTRRGVAAILTDAGGFAVTASTPDPGELGDLGAFDLILVDLYLEDDTPCVPLVARLAAANRVLVMSASRRQGDVRAVIRAGAGGYVTKQSDPELIVSAARTVAAGGFALSAQLADILKVELAQDPEPDTGPGRLSQQEARVLDMIAQGFTHQQIAFRLGIKKSTVDTHVERIRVKLHAGNKADLTRIALERQRRGKA
ncbi:response regulator transcription factor [Streptomyces sp. NPDC046942]|uniref:response regulator transcription factor n=1 Tax=Streptomyces sp. NPDC046942 TaxID=3155137 RepID=UPI0033F2D9B8